MGEMRCLISALILGTRFVSLRRSFQESRCLSAEAQGTTSVSFSRYRHRPKGLEAGRSPALRGNGVEESEQARSTSSLANPYCESEKASLMSWALSAALKTS